jgi:hypothetical protein
MIIKMIKFGVFFHLNKKLTAKIGQRRNNVSKEISIKMSSIRSIKSPMIKNVFITNPKRIAIRTNLFLYSFFQGLKRVLTASGKEKMWRNCSFKDVKYFMREIGAS